MNMTQERNIYRHMMELMQQRNSEERARGGNEIVFPPQHNCPRVEELLASCPLLRKLTLRPLDLNFNFAMPMVEELALIGGWAGAAMVDRLHDVVEEQLPSIKVLKLVGTPKHHLFLRFTSLSLEVIDLRDASKGSWIQRLNCPALREIVCIPTGYGNGLRPFIAAGPVLAPWERPANDLSFQCGINCDSFGAKLTQINDIIGLHDSIIAIRMIEMIKVKSIKYGLVLSEWLPSPALTYHRDGTEPEPAAFLRCQQSVAT
jgi:hypothetical protein